MNLYLNVRPPHSYFLKDWDQQAYSRALENIRHFVPWASVLQWNYIYLNRHLPFWFFFFINYFIPRLAGTLVYLLCSIILSSHLRMCFYPFFILLSDIIPECGVYFPKKPCMNNVKNWRSNDPSQPCRYWFYTKMLNNTAWLRQADIYFYTMLPLLLGLLYLSHCIPGPVLGPI